MLRRALSFVVALAIIAAVSTLVYYNSQPTTFRYGPESEQTLPLAWLLVASALAGAALVFTALLAREGHWALRQWRLLRSLRGVEAAASRRGEARTSILAGRFEAARALLERNTKSPSPCPDDAIDYAESFVAEGRPDQARRYLEGVPSALAEDPRVLLALARCCLACGDKAAAAAALERATTALPASATLHALLRDTLEELGWWSRAEAAQQRLYDLRPDDEERRRLIEIRMKASERGESGEREAALRSVLAMDPAWAPAAAAQARSLASQGRRRAAVRLLLRAAKRRPEEETLDALDELLESSRLSRLLRAYAKLRRLHAADERLARHLAAVLARNGRHEDAERLLMSLPAAGSTTSEESDGDAPPLLEGSGEISSDRQRRSS